MTLSFRVDSTRHLVGRVARGLDLRQALTDLALAHELNTAWLTAIGAFESVTLTEYDQQAQAYQAEHRVGACEVLSVQGNLSRRNNEPFWHLHATVSPRGEGYRVLGGHLVEARVFALEFRMVELEGVTLTRTRDEATGLHLWDGGLVEGQAAASAAVAQAKSESATTGVTWAMAAKASAEATTHEVKYTPAKGDWLDHPKFGLCKIESLGGDGVSILKLADARRKKIQLGALAVLAPRRDGDRVIYPVRPRHKRPS
ncbi:MAG: DUF296 domain-containing protein [Myxococcota bacterium]